MKTRPNATTIQTIKHAAQKLTGSVRREFQAAVTLNHCHGSPRFARELFGWHHDMTPSGILVPLGILEVKQKQFNVVCGNSLETSDFIVDGLAHWWRYNKHRYSNITSLQIDLDNGPEIESHRTQFIKRMVNWSDKIKLPIELVYYPPYHSKYNPVEHCWGVLERHWNGALLTDMEAVREWTKSMRWDGIAPNVYVVDKEYHRGVALTAREMESYSKRVLRTPMIERWSLVIQQTKPP